MKNKIAALILAVVLVGCSTHAAPPPPIINYNAILVIDTDSTVVSNTIAYYDGTNWVDFATYPAGATKIPLASLPLKPLAAYSSDANGGRSEYSQQFTNTPVLATPGLKPIK